MSSPWQGVFRTYDIGFVTEGPPYVDDPNGNPQPTRTTVIVTATLRESRDPTLRASLGADELTVVLKGRCVNPMSLPVSLTAGAEAALSVNGRPGVFHLLPAWPASIPEIDLALGQPIAGTWRAA